MKEFHREETRELFLSPHVTAVVVTISISRKPSLVAHRTSGDKRNTTQALSRKQLTTRHHNEVNHIL